MPQMQVSFQHLPDINEYLFEISCDTYAEFLGEDGLRWSHNMIVITPATAGKTPTHIGTAHRGRVCYTLEVEVHELKGNVAHGSVVLCILDGSLDKMVWKGSVDVSIVVGTPDAERRVSQTLGNPLHPDRVLQVKDFNVFDYESGEIASFMEAVTRKDMKQIEQIVKAVRKRKQSIGISFQSSSYKRPEQIVVETTRLGE